MSRETPAKAKISKPRKKALPPKVNSIVDLARILGVAARTIRGWKTATDCPIADASGRYDVGEWMEWAAKRGKETPPQGPTTKQEWEIERIRRQVEAMDLDLKIQRGEFVSIEDVKRWASECAGAFRVDMLAIPGKLAPQVVGLTIPEAELRIRNEITEALRHMSRAPWAKDERSK